MNSDILKKIQKFFYTKHRKEVERNPYSDWSIILISACVVFLIVAGIDGYIFYKISRGELFNTDDTSAPAIQVFDRSLLKKENDYYSGQEQNFKNIQTNPRVVIDPSI